MTFKLTEEQEQWLQALESGDYEQGHTFLCQRTANGGKKYCCLGVAAELFDPDRTEWDYAEETGQWQYLSGSRKLGPRVCRLLDLRSPLGHINRSVKVKGVRLPKASLSLAAFNDVDNLTFAEIAALIRANPAAFFRRAQFDE